MKDLLYTIAILLLIVWAIGVLIFGAKGIIHALFIFSIVVLIIKVFQKKKVV